jgi:tRNA 2-thiouridine synthesizing protein E
LANLKLKNKDYQVDEHGYLSPPEQWDDDFAMGMAETLGISSGLSEWHWKIIRYLRKKFVEEKTVPITARACLDNGINLQELRSLFPTGYHRGACKIAGINYRFLPAPTIPKKPQYKLDEIGFLADFDAWDLGFVEYMMKELGGGSPTGRHWDVIRYLRDYYQEHRNIPSVYEACSANDLSLKELTELFPDGYRRGACRLAGLPFNV